MTTVRCVARCMVVARQSATATSAPRTTALRYRPASSLFEVRSSSRVIAGPFEHPWTWSHPLSDSTFGAGTGFAGKSVARPKVYACKFEEGQSLRVHVVWRKWGSEIPNFRMPPNERYSRCCVAKGEERSQDLRMERSALPTQRWRSEATADDAPSAGGGGRAPLSRQGYLLAEPGPVPPPNPHPRPRRTGDPRIGTRPRVPQRPGSTARRQVLPPCAPWRKPSRGAPRACRPAVLAAGESCRTTPKAPEEATS